MALNTGASSNHRRRRSGIRSKRSGRCRSAIRVMADPGLPSRRSSCRSTAASGTITSTSATSGPTTPSTATAPTVTVSKPASPPLAGATLSARATPSAAGLRTPVTGTTGNGAAGASAAVPTDPVAAAEAGTVPGHRSTGRHRLPGQIPRSSCRPAGARLAVLGPGQRRDDPGRAQYPSRRPDQGHPHHGSPDRGRNCGPAGAQPRPT